MKFFDENKKRMTAAQIAAIEWRDVELDINLSVSTVFVNNGTFGCVACPQSVLVRAHETAEFSDGEQETFD